MKEKYQPSQEEIDKAEGMMTEKERELTEKRMKEYNLMKSVHTISSSLTEINEHLGTLISDNIRTQKVFDKGTLEEQETFINDMLERTKPLEEKAREEVDQFMNQLNSEIAEAKKQGGYSLQNKLEMITMGIFTSSFDDYIILDQPLESSIEYYLDSAEKLNKIERVAKENNLSYGMMVGRIKGEKSFLGERLIERIKKSKDMDAGDKEKTILKIEALMEK